MNLRFEFDRYTAIKVAEYLQASGMAQKAADMWYGICAADPYERMPRERFGELAYDLRQANFAKGSVERSRFILRVIGLSYPTKKLAEAYFENLTRLLGAKPKRERPGQVVLGLGPGRCGSTTLAAALGSVEDALATHENPCGIFWQPEPAQLHFHWRRFQMLTERYAVTFDAAHWWLPAIEAFFNQFPEGKAIGLLRDTTTCARSFLSVKGQGAGSLNHWATKSNGIWATSPGDPTYPMLTLPPGAAANPDAAKQQMVEDYVRQYNARLEELAEQFPQRVVLIRTEDLNREETGVRLSEFIGQEVRMPERALNVGGTADSDRHEMTY